MGEVAQFDTLRLRFQPSLSKGRNVRFDKSNAAIVGIEGANIAEGCCRKGDVEMGRFLQIAIGSASELEYQLLLAHDLHYLCDPDYQRLETQVVEVKRMLSSLMRKVRTDS